MGVPIARRNYEDLSPQPCAILVRAKVQRRWSVAHSGIDIGRAVRMRITPSGIINK